MWSVDGTIRNQKQHTRPASTCFRDCTTVLFCSIRSVTPLYSCVRFMVVMRFVDIEFSPLEEVSVRYCSKVSRFCQGSGVCGFRDAKRTKARKDAGMYSSVEYLYTYMITQQSGAEFICLNSSHASSKPTSEMKVYCDTNNTGRGC